MKKGKPSTTHPATLLKIGIFVMHDEYTATPINQWLKHYDPDGNAGRGLSIFTEDPAQAMAFANALEAALFYMKTSTVKPMRPDGNPNRPLTAYTVSIKNIPTCTASPTDNPAGHTGK